MRGSEFKDIRDELGLTQDELAEVLCLSGKVAISNIETGFRNPSLLTIVLMRVLSGLTKNRSKEFQKIILSFREKELSRKGRKS